ncbi:hypothetical protein L1D14_23045 [Vibrio tubiashii]|uniref:hypothetical protein n=1 Tax=Vibrio tubiashii TaxID=29498 RepID=UPI001EFCF64C|nr:hypothetical protein [Vibrio tubiashii]MCG9579082.1 hypothetical protein [Vibrio tubiashii]
MNSEVSYEFLPYGDWSSGGCLLLSLAMKELYPMGCLVGLKNVSASRESQVIDHVVFRFDQGIYVDRFGAGGLDSIISNDTDEYVPESATIINDLEELKLTDIYDKDWDVFGFTRWLRTNILALY